MTVADTETRRVELWIRGSVPVDIRQRQMTVHDRLKQ